MSSKELLSNGKVSLGEAAVVRCYTKIGVSKYTCSTTGQNPWKWPLEESVFRKVAGTSVRATLLRR